MKMCRKFLCLILLMLFSAPAFPYTYKGSAKLSRPANDSEYEELAAKFPKHRQVISKLYGKYSGWVTEIAESYGISPLLAVYGHDDAEGVWPILRRDIGIFTEIFDALGGLQLPENARASTALDILTAFTVCDSEDIAKYYSGVKSAGLKDSGMSFTGRKANYYARKIPDSPLMPANLLHELKANDPECYGKLLHEISRADYDTLKAFCDYPNGLTFLINTGREGSRLIDETGGQIIVLSWFLPDDEQKRLPETFRKYPRLSEALKICGADSFFTVMLCPELFFSLSELLEGTKHERFIMAYAVILSQSNAGVEAVNFLNTLSPDSRRKIARYTAEIMNLPDDDNNFGGSLAPVNEALFMKFVLRYGDGAAEMCRKFSSLLDVSKLLMTDWRGDVQDVSPVIEAVKDFGLMGLQAAIHFRFAGNIQGLILNHPNVSRRKELLMFMLYDNVTGHKYTENIAKLDNAAKFLLENYTIDRYTGEPLEIEESTASYIAGYIPGHDVIAPIYNYVRYGKMPTVSECLEGAMDLMELVPMAKSAVTVVKEIAKGGGKKILEEYAKKAVKEVRDKVIDIADKELSLVISNMVAKYSVSEMKKDTASLFGELGSRSAVIMSEMSIPSWENISDFTKYISSKAKTLSINTTEIFSRKPELSKLYSKPYMTKRAADSLIESSGRIQEAALMKTLNVMGVNSIINYLYSE